MTYVSTGLSRRDTGFLDEPVKDWPLIPAYLAFKLFVQNLPIVNDACERLLKRTSDYKEVGGKGEKDFQETLQVVEDAVRRVKNRKSKKALKEAYDN